jgi:CheY-like chemotaxis protein
MERAGTAIALLEVMPSTSVLLVEDESLFRDVAAQALTAALPSIDILTACNGQEAIELINAHHPAVVVTDLHMPVVDGFAVLSHLAKCRSKASVVVMSAFLNEEYARQIAANGAVVCLDKPVELSRLVTSVRTLLATRATGHVEGVTLPGFVQLLQMEKKNVTLRVTSEDANGTGLLHFTEGNLTDAWDGERAGEMAALRILGWNAEIDVITPRLSDRRTIESSTMLLVMEAARLQDEQSAAPGRARRNSDPFAMMDLEAPDFLLPILPSQESPERAPSAVTMSVLPPPATERYDLKVVEQVLQAAVSIEGALGASLTDWTTCTTLGANQLSGELDVTLAGGLNCEVVRAKMKTMEALGIRGTIEDILISLDEQYDLIRPLKSSPNLFLYLALDRSRSNLALARMKLQLIEKTMVL